MSDRPNTPKEGAAYDSGHGHRSITHDRTNPYCRDVTPGQHAAWERGWEAADRELNKSA